MLLMEEKVCDYNGYSIYHVEKDGYDAKDCFEIWKNGRQVGPGQFETDEAAKEWIDDNLVDEGKDFIEKILSGVSVRKAILEDFTSDVVNKHKQGGSIYFPNETETIEAINSVLDDTILGNIFTITDEKETDVDGCMFKDITISTTPIDETKLEALGSTYAKAIRSILVNTLSEKLNLGNNVEIKLDGNDVKIRFSIL